jgi:hypothetical protein
LVKGSSVPCIEAPRRDFSSRAPNPTILFIFGDLAIIAEQNGVEDTRRTLFLLTFGSAVSALVLTGVMVRGTAVSHPSGFFFFVRRTRFSSSLSF